MWVLEARSVHLVSTGISWQALSQIVCARHFVDGVTLSEALIPERISHAREPERAAGRAQRRRAGSVS